MKTKLLLIALFVFTSITSNSQTSGVRIESPVSYRVTIWTDDVASLNIKIHVNGVYEGYITQAYSSSPSCGAAGCVTVKLSSARRSNVIRAYYPNGTERAYELTEKPDKECITLYMPKQKPTSNKSDGSSTSSSRSSSSSSSTSSSSSSSNYSSSSRPGEYVAGKATEAAIDSGMSAYNAALMAGRGVYIGDEYRYGIIGVGTGLSYGGIGTKISMRLSRNVSALGLSFGYGYSPFSRNKVESVSSSMFFGGGFQMYIKNFHIDFQIMQTTKVLYKRNEERKILGLGIGMGYNWFFTDNFGMNLGVGMVGPMAQNGHDGENDYMNSEALKPRFTGEFGFFYRLW